MTRTTAIVVFLAIKSTVTVMCALVLLTDLGVL